MRSGPWCVMRPWPGPCRARRSPSWATSPDPRRSSRRNVLRALGWPGWFDYNAADQCRLVFRQGDERHAGDPSDGVVARRQIAEVLVRSLVSAAAERKTFELVAEIGPATADLAPLFAALDADPPDALDAVRDTANLPLDGEPQRVRDDLEAVRSREGR